MAKEEIKAGEALFQEALINSPSFLKELIRKGLQSLLDEQFKEALGALPYERAEERKGYRNGSYSRSLMTRVGRIELKVPRDREGSFSPSLFERYQRSEKAFLLALMEMVVQGISTRKVSAVVEEMCGEGVSKSLVSSLSEKLDKEIEDWRKEKLPEEAAHMLLDATYVKCRDAGKVTSKALLIATLVTRDGERMIAGVYLEDKESEAFWGNALSDLKKRGLEKVHFVTTDEHSGLKKALQKEYGKALWQRCQVHFMRNFLSRVPKKETEKWTGRLRDLLNAPTKEEGKRRAKELVQELQAAGREELADWLEEGAEEALTVLHLPESLRKRCRTTNMLERLNQEIKRRTRVVRIYPHKESLLRMVSALCMEKSEEWSGKPYLDAALLIETLQKGEEG